MSKDITDQLRRAAPTPRRELSATFTQQTLSKITNKKRGFHWLILKPAPVFIAVFVLLTVSTATYAAFNWQQIQVWFTGKQTNQTFNAQEFGFKFESCNALGVQGNNLRFGVADQNVTTEQLENLIKARCEVAQAKQLFESQSDWKGKIPPKLDSKTSQPLIDDIFFAGSIEKVVGVKDGKLSTSFQRIDWQKNTPTETINEANLENVRVYANGQQVGLNTLKPGDNIVTVRHLITKQQEPGSQVYDLQVESVIGIIKIASQQPDPSLYDKVFEIMPCRGNPDATCLDTPSPALTGFSFNANEGEGGSFIRRTDITYDGSNQNAFDAQGRIISIDDQGFTLKAFESERQFRVEIAAKDRTRTVELGDAIAVLYMQKPNEDHSVVRASDIVHSTIILKGTEKKF